VPSSHVAFKGDVAMLSAARQEVRSRVEVKNFIIPFYYYFHMCHLRISFLNLQSSRSITDPEQLTQLRAEGVEAAAFLRTSIMQASTNDSGSYGK